MSPSARFPRPTTSDIDVPAEVSEALDKELEFEQVESREARTHRLSTGVLIAIMAVILFFLLTKTSGKAHFAFTDALAGKDLGTLTVSGFPTVLVSAIACLLAAGAFFVGRSRHTLTLTAGVVAGIAIVIGFLSWAAAGRELPFQVAGQLQGTLSVATPLVLGALCGVMCERAGVVNVAIEGQMLTAAFAAALVGSMTQTVFAAIVAAAIASVLTAALLAVFTIKYFVDEVVMGVVVNLFASGLTGFLYTQLLSPEAEKYNTAPIMAEVPIPVLSKIPFFGPIFFDQTILVYIGFLCIPLVWFLLWRTKWGLRVRSVGEHPEAADTVGISVAGIRWSAVLVGGIFAGLGGAYFTIGTVGSFSKDITVGNGFIALAALIMGRWRPGLAAVMALFFSFVTQLSTELSTISAPMPSQFLLILPYIATIVAVAGLVGKVRSPAADGTPYIKE
ncbi:ABC transporter permease [Cutibacterium sp.]|uniref:ABC transporter permease n=1 Tax=Cutibacterium sp. TaxID=1912221 RepID=UPI0026DC6665|nr:ABC transporter permease [Cutibacterium sp.]MDO4413222.1 ABC transporter permease [Cutibacterium sp.]